ncbi:calpain-B-like isoform X9, partial [Biomphalaria glabrata]
MGETPGQIKKNPFASLAYQKYDKYDEILAKCQRDGILFEDPEFEAVDTSIFFSSASSQQYEWKRPG